MARPKTLDESRVVSFRLPENAFKMITKSGLTKSEAMRHIVDKFVDSDEELPGSDYAVVTREEALLALDKARAMLVDAFDELDAGLETSADHIKHLEGEIAARDAKIAEYKTVFNNAEALRRRIAKLDKLEEAKLIAAVYEAEEAERRELKAPSAAAPAPSPAHEAVLSAMDRALADVSLEGFKVKDVPIIEEIEPAPSPVMEHSPVMEAPEPVDQPTHSIDMEEINATSPVDATHYADHEILTELELPS